MSDMPYRDVGYPLPLVGERVAVLCHDSCWCRERYAEPPHWAARWVPTGEVPLWSWLGVAS